ncbi:SpoIIE family protein phosphatase [Spongiactinospora sp. TRM90649]|uniref:PP2C family protein-serine/threonine phosphatase n=1 Tax=Spongiactinospora sp. TRM90649 TaxID=3031114 RepID=UPI0023F61739|nr:SpoIIE family protein phosphatase [Spongiactinospora sp. TRM90649]MDF5754681.1 SpoIIE family protein phosphatase [Spongiactinospora sp. TRM90649]
MISLPPGTHVESSDRPYPLTLLLIEDDPGDAYLVQELLGATDAPPKIIWARSLADGLARLSPEVHCVLVDLSMPDATGLQAPQQVLARAPHAAVLVLTGLDDAQAGAAAVAAGAEDYLVKGEVTTRQLDRAIRYALERKHAVLARQRLLEAERVAEENARLEHGLLPVALLRTDDLEHHTRYIPGRQEALLAGDFYDTVQTPDGAVHIVIGDVSGHGPDEAALGVALRIAWRTLVLAGHTGTDMLRILDALLRQERNAPEIFTTICTVTIAPALDSARMWVVGHPPPLVMDGDAIDFVPGTPSGPPLGIFPDAEWPAIDVPLGRDWALLLYTDGLIEASMGSGLLGLEGLMRMVREHGGFDFDGIVNTITERRQIALNDDLALLLVRRRTGSAS